MKKENFSQAIDEVLKSKPNITIQKENPKSRTIDAIAEKQVSFYIEKTLLKQLKIKALDEGLNFKGIMNAAINRYLE